MKNIIILVALVVFASCSTRSIDKKNVAAAPLISIYATISDSSFTNLKGFLKMSSYTILSSDIPLGEIKRIIINSDRIFVLDSEPKIICFNSDGSIKYKIASKGKGPGQFVRIIDFSVDQQNGFLNIYDSSKRKLIHYSINDGNFISEQAMETAPHAIASFSGSNYFFNPYNYNYPTSKEFHYSLLYSKKGSSIDLKYLPHDPVISSFMFGSGYEHPFFYNSDQLLFINRFDKLVYSLGKDEVLPKYEINLPTPVPLTYFIRNKNPKELLDTEYSYGLSDIYQCDSILYYTFSNKRSIIFNFYDLGRKKLIYCGKRIWPTPSAELPLFYPIRGVYKNQFFSIVNPSAILELAKGHKEVFPTDLTGIKETDNPVILFYALDNEK